MTARKKASIMSSLRFRSRGHRDDLSDLRMDIGVVELHSHTRTDNPRLFYPHVWVDAEALARTPRTAVDAAHTAR
jgi:hypothetical protein